MRNFTAIHQGLVNAYGAVLGGRGSGVSIVGESGIGKTYLIDEFLLREVDGATVIRLRGENFPMKAFSVVYHALYELIRGPRVTKERYLSILKRYTKLLPGFGQFVSVAIETFEREREREAIAQCFVNSGLQALQSPYPHLIEFICEIADGKPLVVVSDDSQWLDQESWGLVAFIAERLTQINLLLVVLQTSDSGGIGGGHADKLQSNQVSTALIRWQTRSDTHSWRHYIAERWQLDTLPHLCASILQTRCQISTDNIKFLFEHTSGVPVHVRSILQMLRDMGHLVLDGNIYLDHVGWESLDLKTAFQDSVAAIVERAYLSVPNAKMLLETASVLGERFRDKDIDGILALSNSYDIFAQIARDHSVVRYLFDPRAWAFCHGLFRRQIYRSLGDDASAIHLRIAHHLEVVTDVDLVVLAEHYRRGGDLRKAIWCSCQEIERLWGMAMFSSALALARDVSFEAQGAGARLNEGDFARVNLVLGRSLFYGMRYEDALETFHRLSLRQLSPAIRAEGYRWCGRCLAKSDSQQDFEHAIDYLKRAIAIYEESDDVHRLGEIFTDIVAIYAHLNAFEDAESAYRRAENLLNQAGDTIGMARLHRRCVIFMESRLAIPILERVADTFEAYGIPHERLMALNNAATAYLEVGGLLSAQRHLEAALQESEALDNFGYDYVANNLALYYLHSGEAERARGLLRAAREHAEQVTRRAVVRLIIDVNDAAATVCLEGVENALPKLERCLRIAVSTGEATYILPAELNLARAFLAQSRFKDAWECLSCQLPISAHSIRNRHAWYELAISASKGLGDRDAVAHIERDFAWCLDRTSDQPESPQYALIDMQFWSD